MIKLEVTERTFVRDCSWTFASMEESRHTLCSVDLDGDDLSVYEKEPGDYYFSEDTALRFYNIDADDNTKDFYMRESLLDVAQLDAQEMRYWFRDIPVGTYGLDLTIDQDDSIEFHSYFRIIE